MERSLPPLAHAVPVCGIGASAGGIEALQQFFGALRADLGLAYVVILHLAPHRKSELPAIIGRWTPMPVVQVGDHDKVPLAPDTVYVIAPDRQLMIVDGNVSGAPFDHPRGRRAAIDMFFRSLAATHGDGFAVLLSGSGSDGALGAKAVKEQGGLVLVQDPSDAGHSGMPAATISLGVADLVLPARELAVQLAELASSKRQAERILRTSEGREPPSAEDEKTLKRVLDALRKRTGHDFSKYKRATVLRRVSRRMQLVRQPTLVDYLQHLRAQPTELQALFNDLLISVTTFFRDPEAWAALEAQVVDPLVESADADEPLRVWAPGCATGEEAYTLAMLFHEAFERRKTRPGFTIFASDVDEGSLAIAREGIYPQAIAADVSESRLERHFRREDDHFRVAAEIRDHLVFAAHSILRDPPFARQHLISCRNVLIYLDRDLQEQMMNVFRYACRDDGFLFLGASESADEDVFQAMDNRHRIFRVRPSEHDARPVLPDILAAPGARLRSFREPRAGVRPTGAELHIAALEEAAPPSVVVDERWDVLHLSSSAARFFQQSGGPVARRLTDLVRPELRDDLHTALQHAFESGEPHLTPFVNVRFDAAPRKVAVLAQPRARAEDGGALLVTFLDAGASAGEPPAGETEPSTGLVRELRERLRLAEQRLESMRDDHRLTMEDLRAANEELQSLNEEYRSTTEELETSKEELQSINEELHTVNHELKLKLQETSTANSDLENLISATNVATLFLNPELRIKRFTPQLREIFKVQPRDVDRPITDLMHTLDYAVEQDARRVLGEGIQVEREISGPAGRSFIVRLAPYRHRDGASTDGVVVTFIDVTRLKEAELALRRRTSELEASQQQLSAQAADLRAQDRHREEFLAALGHELRNPMAAMQSSLGLLSVSDDRSQRALTVLTRQMRHMGRLVDDLLDVTRVRHGVLHLQRMPTDVVAAGRAALDTVRNRAERKGVRLSCQLPGEALYLDADPERLAQILDNLLQNALTYTDDGEVRLEVALEDQHVRLTVSDTGIGLTPEDASGLFQPYHRAPTRQRGEGLGLGLALVKGLVEAHGGAIEARSDGEGTGTRFSVTLPLLASRPSGAALEPVELSHPPRHRVLVVDDNRDVADMFAALLDAMGQDVAVAYDGPSAIALAVERHPDVVFLDLTMPGMNGAEVAGRLRKAGVGCTLVAVTGHDGRHPGLRTGSFDHHLIKPVRDEALAELLGALPLDSGR